MTLNHRRFTKRFTFETSETNKNAYKVRYFSILFLTAFFWSLKFHLTLIQIFTEMLSKRGFHCPSRDFFSHSFSCTIIPIHPSKITWINVFMIHWLTLRKQNTRLAKVH